MLDKINAIVNRARGGRSARSGGLALARARISHDGLHPQRLRFLAAPRAPRTSSPRCSPPCSPPSSLQIVFRYLPQSADRLDPRAQRHALALARAVGRRLRHQRATRRSASISSTAPSDRGARRVMAIVTAVALDRPLRRLASGGSLDYVTFMKVRDDRLSEDHVRLPVLDLHRLRGRRRRPLPLARSGRPLRGVAPEAFDPTKASSGV